MKNDWKHNNNEWNWMDKYCSECDDCLMIEIWYIDSPTAYYIDSPAAYIDWPAAYWLTPCIILIDPPVLY